MTTFTEKQLIEICPHKTEKIYNKWAEFDGAEARVVELLGSGTNQKVRVRLQGGERTGIFVLPAELLKPVKN